MCLYRLCGVALLCLSAAHQSFATTYLYTYTQGSKNGPAADNTGGFIDTFTAKFDSSSKRLFFSVAFAPATGQTVLGTHGFWLVTSNGDMPRGLASRFAMYYFDAANLNNPTLTVYTYNGTNSPDSYRAGDLIKGAFNYSGMYTLSSKDMMTDSGFRRVMSFDIDATNMLTHAPLTPSATSPWYGTGFGEQIGLWMQPVLGYAATYGAPNGWIGNLSYTNPGWITISNASTTFDTPAPAAGGVLTMLTLAVSARRRRP